MFRSVALKPDPGRFNILPPVDRVFYSEDPQVERKVPWTAQTHTEARPEFYFYFYR